MRISKDSEPPVPATPGALSSALAGFKRRMDLVTGDKRGRLTVAWRDGARCITQEQSDIIRTTIPLTGERIEEILQRVLRGDPDWDAGLQWLALPPRDREQLRIAGLVIGPALFVIAWYVLLLVFLPRILYDIPRCKAYAAAAGRAYVRYYPGVSRRYGRDTPAACVMADGSVRFAAAVAAAPASPPNALLFEKGLYAGVMWVAMLIGLLLLYRRLKQTSADRPGWYPPAALGPKRRF